MLSLKAVLTSPCLTVFLSSSVLRKVVVACGAMAWWRGPAGGDQVAMARAPGAR